MTKNAIEWLEKYYHFVLMNTKVGKKAKEYLLQRGIEEDTIKKFKLGYSPYDVRPTLVFLKGKGFDLDDLVKRRVISQFKSGKQKGKFTDNFKGRIIFPIQNHYGKTIAFGGRSLRSNDKIKYLNSPETKNFVKGDNLYAFSHAKKNIKKQEFVVLLEGYFDVISAHQAGLKNSVATLGTALTVNQAVLLRSVTKNVVISFDGDKAGMESSLKSASILEKVGCNVRIANIEGDLDPDEFIQKHGNDVFIKEVIAKAQSRLDFFINFKKKEHDLSSQNERYSFSREVFDEFSMNEPGETKKVLERLGIELKVPIDEIYKEIQKGV